MTTDALALARLDAVAQAELLARGELTASELLESCAARVEALSPLIRALPTVDFERARACRPAAGPLSGVPFVVKDVTSYPGLRWSLGSRLFAGNLAAPPTPYTDRLDAAGLLTVGKSATCELGLLGSTETLLEGITHNPWDLSRSAAGSSGGAAAAVAAGLVPMAHASDGGGSIRIPASVCGLFGFMPSRGRCVPAALGTSDFGELVVDHAISRAVRDSALLPGALVIGRLSLTERADGPFARVGYVRRPVERRLRIAAWTRTLAGEEPDASVRRAHEGAVELCLALGHEVHEVPAPAIDGRALGDAFFIVAGAMVSGVVDTMQRLRGRPVEPHELEPFTWAVIEDFRRAGPEAVAAAREVMARAAALYLETVRAHDVVLTPTLAVPPWPIGHLSPLVPADELRRRTVRAVGYTPIHNVAGCPAMSVPLGWTDDGLPLGSCFAAAPGEDALLLGLAYQLEEARPWRDRWAPFSYPALFGR